MSWVPSLGGLNLSRVLDWTESKRTPIPKKSVLNRDAPSPEAETYSDYPNMHTILCRLMPSELNTLYVLMNTRIPQQLFQIQGDPVIMVWIENFEVAYAMIEHNVAYWLTTIYLVET